MMSFFKRAHMQTEEESNTDHMLEDTPFSESMHMNIGRIQKAFFYPLNHVLKTKNVVFPSIGREGTILYLEGTVDADTIEEHIIGPIVQSTFPYEQGDAAAVLLQHVLTVMQAEQVSRLQAAVSHLLNGNTLIFLEGCPLALTVPTAGFAGRSVNEPAVENVLRGPKEAFIESAETNRSLIRKMMKNRHLVCEIMKVNQQETKQVSVMYRKDIANPELVAEVKERIAAIESDAVLTLAILEQYIEERPYSLIPSTLMTERPDRACALLQEGHIVLLMDNSPYALVVPITFWTLFHTSEDQFLRWPYGNFIRIIRLLSIFTALLLPSLYIAVSTFHEEMLPTDLVLAISATRERVPFPAFLEVLIMELSFELVREAGIRVPTVIGPTIGIVGALILGQAAVDANIISPILVIIVALTGLSSFAISELSFNFAIRILRFLLLLTASLMGFFGIALLLTCLIAYMVSFESFGIPFLSPMAPHGRSSKDLLVRPPVWKQWLLPFNLQPIAKTKAKRPGGKSDS
ncbi:spore germination protein [Ectobacillus ponti]|uniref:Spore germination protein n=1 Tax=Ectobacillus ponti TaxID=2961894 RepID=A0AA42BR96_9BACI|nr:spore germination protein [Ectobacillus ponti]MCP8969249.1 spore germination protein [Ectobacillus ponti]